MLTAMLDRLSPFGDSGSILAFELSYTVSLDELMQGFGFCSMLQAVITKIHRKLMALITPYYSCCSDKSPVF